MPRCSSFFKNTAMNTQESTTSENSLVLSLTPEHGTCVRILSDLHYGHPRSRVPEPEQLVARMQGVDILVIAGDLAETRPAHACREQGLALRERFRSACARAGIQLIELAGNHDTDAPHMMLRLWGGSTIVVHGHMFFDEVAPWGWEYLYDRASSDALIASYPTRGHDLRAKLELARALSLHVRPVHKSRLHTPIPLLNKMLHCFWPPQRPYNILRAWLIAPHRAELFARQFAPESRHIIFGHFHRCGAWRRAQRELFCTGAWFEHARGAAVDFKDGELIRYFKF